MRPKEARELTWEQIDFEAGIIVQTQHKTARKTGKPRIIGLDPATMRFLANLYRQRPEGTDHVFLNRCGRPWKRSTLCSHMSELCNRLGLPEDLTPYTMRHARATEAIISGMGERQLADHLGHSNTRMIQRYSHAASKAEYLRDIARQAVRRKKPQLD
jgi:integrase